MSRVGSGPSRRVRAYAYTLVTSVVVLLFALLEWLAERYVSERSRAASTVIEVVIVLIAALVFRPIHQRVEKAVEQAFYRRKREALAALARFRRELTSFTDLNQLLRRVIEAVEHHLESSACAVYLRRDRFHADASSFDVPAPDVSMDDPLIVRLRSSASPARQRALTSAALGSHAFPMTAAGEVTGFLAVQCKDRDYDSDEEHMLAGLAADLATALAALDPALRPRKVSRPNNLPADLAPLIGRERELTELKTALRSSRLLTLSGAGGVGKTRIALQCALETLEQYDDGAWFVNLAPISDGALIAGTVLTAMGASAGEGSDVERAVAYLRPRTALLVIDNCEHVLGDVTRLIARLQGACTGISILATSREILHVRGEDVYRLQPLRVEAAMDLFAQRAALIAHEFDAAANEQPVRSICEHLDGIPLAIELAAARMRAMSAHEILERLTERFRLLTGGTRTALPRQQTLSAAIDWSYGLLTLEEQSLFLRLATFRGTFTLAAAAAVCAKDGRCDEFRVLDVLTSLADKSLLVVALGLTTRYRMLETIREFAMQKAVERQAAGIAAQQHAAYFAAVAAQAYHEFDSHLQPGWLDRLAPDIDNFRAALSWSLEGGGNRRAGAQLAADCAPVFLRLDLLAEGLRWCDSARAVTPVSAATAGRIDYMASMLYTNIDEREKALECANRALASYRESSDERGLVRALSQVAQLLARAKRYDDAAQPAAEAIARAGTLGEPHVLIGVLRRCAYSLPPERIAQARQYYAQALELARDVRETDEECRVLQWWATSEAACAQFSRAIDLAEQGLRCAGRDSQLALRNHLACWYLAQGNIDAAAPHVVEALTLGLEVQHPLRAFAIAYAAPLHANRDAREAAIIFGFAQARLAQLGHTPQAEDELAMQTATQAIKKRLHDEELAPLLERGANFSENDILRLLQPLLTGGGETHSAPVAARNRVNALLI